MADYKLYTDKAGKFECTVNVKGASTKNSIARLVVESKDLSLVFDGEISNGKCIIPLRKLEGIFEDKQTGKIRLEIIVDKTYFVPWKSDFVVETEKIVEVKVDEIQEQEPIVEVVVDVQPEKPKMDSIKVKNVNVKENAKSKHVFENAQTELVYELLKSGITSKNLSENMKLAEEVCSKFFLKNKKHKKDRSTIIKEAMQIIKSEK